GSDPLKGPVRFLRRNRLRNPADRLAVAEDDELSGVLHDGKAASLHLDKEWLTANKTLNVTNLAADHATLSCRL
ncbi:MAG: hypothetical protein WBB13_10985, partial [Tabrizicola sp.]